MKFIIDYDIFRIFPDLRIGIVLGRKVRIRLRLQELENLIEDNTKILLKRMKNKKLTDFTNIKSWHETYRQIGLNHKKYSPTVEKLIRRMIKGQNFPVINTAVNAYLAAAFLTMLPIGGYDLEALDGDIRLRVSKGGELFKPLGGGDMEFTEPGEIVYSDSKTILTRHWNCRDSDSARITENSTMIIIACEAALKDINTRDLIETLCKIVEYESAFCKGMYSIFILDKINPEVEFQ
ncbi:MAG: phenylalanine--tRNA ligase beta subunit-related protein [Candidatus Aminicenantes bacterium]|jgi:DNA/RNA-binding domain of Phe-tRNA-synthetase-like protein